MVAKYIAKKDNPQKVKGAPYDEYVLVIYCDEPRVRDCNRLIEYIRGATFPRTALINRAFLLFSFDAWQEYCPYIELNLNSV